MNQRRSSELRLAVAQPETRAHNVAANVAAHAALVRASGARVVVFPELSLTGYEFDAAPLAPNSALLSPLVEACRQAGAVALAGAPVDAPTGEHAPSPGGRSLAMLMIDGAGARVVYRKMWLGEAEQRHFVVGNHPAVVEVDGWRIGLAICRDTGMAEHAAATCEHQVDVYAAGVLEHESDAHIQPARARRIAAAHQVWVAVASFAGSTGEGFDKAAGGSGIWRPDGSRAATATSKTGEFTGSVLRPGSRRQPL